MTKPQNEAPPNNRKYIDLKLELRDLNTDDDSFKVSVLPSSVGETQQPTTVPYRFSELQDDLDSLDQKKISPEDLIALGERLAARLLPPGPVRELFQRTLVGAGRDGGVRLRLLIREPKLAQLPWEFSYLQVHAGEKDRRHFLCLNPQVSIVRHEALPEPPTPLAGATPERLRMVAGTVNVEGQYQLKLEDERKVIAKALSNFKVDGVTIEWEPFIENLTAHDLALALQQRADLFHFAGHGVFAEEGADKESGESTGAGYLVLAKDKTSGEPALFAASDLASLLQTAGVRVALLGACDSGRRDGITAWTSVASALVERGTPAVIAMQYEVLDDSSIAFSEMFYSAIAAGLSVDEAVAAGRQAMLRASDDEDVEWGVPVLYMRSSNGVIFPKLGERKTATAAALRRVIRQSVKTIKAGGKVTGIKAKRVSGTATFEIIQDVDIVEGGELSGGEFDELS